MEWKRESGKKVRETKIVVHVRDGCVVDQRNQYLHPHPA